MKVIAIILATRMPRSRAISLSWAVACIFLPSDVFSKKKYWNTRSATVATMITMYCGSTKTPARFRTSGGVGRCIRNGSAPKTICAPFLRKMDTPMVAMMTGRNVRWRRGSRQCAERRSQIPP